MRKVAIIGDYNSNEESHKLIDDSIKHLSGRLAVEIEFKWILSNEGDFSESSLNKYNGFWIAPGSPYRNMNNVLEVIRYAREQRVPLLGTCAGFQHMAIEFSRNVLGIPDADSQENDMNCPNPVVVLLDVSLVNQSERLFTPYENSKFYQSVNHDNLIGKYLCNYGFNHNYLKIFEQNELKAVAINKNGHARAFELLNHPFFVGTLFLPQLDFKGSNSYGIIQAFLESL